MQRVIYSKKTMRGHWYFCCFLYLFFNINATSFCSFFFQPCLSTGQISPPPCSTHEDSQRRVCFRGFPTPNGVKSQNESHLLHSPSKIAPPPPPTPNGGFGLFIWGHHFRPQLLCPFYFYAFIIIFFGGEVGNSHSESCLLPIPPLSLTQLVHDTTPVPIHNKNQPCGTISFFLLFPLMFFTHKIF